MNASQTQAVKYFRAFLTRDPSVTDPWPLAVTKFEVKDDTIVAISAQRERTNLPDASWLRAVDHEYWLVIVGERGALNVKMAPASYKQFNGKRAFRMNFDL